MEYDSNNYQLYSDTTRCLEFLKKEGFQLLLVSNHVWQLPKIISDLRIDSYFTHIITSARVGFRKPHPQIFTHAVELSGETPSDIAFIGDSYSNDVMGSKQVGLSPILIDRENKVNRDQTDEKTVGLSNNEDEIMIRSYRPPENIMNTFYNEKSDIWGMGCIIFELLTGEYLFDIDRELSDNQKDRQHLHQMCETLGKIPKEYALNCEFSEQLFDNQGRILNNKQCDYRNLEEIFITDYEYSENDAKNISNFLKKLLDYNIKTRYSAQQAYNDIWLNEVNEAN